ncbi:hypothetical protein [Telluribacter humicola]|uniref:hypothetical protein n=1 Tax=Telluribacter humicola TaxID=1720261 RepID=UPI001A975D25|nr:hypothetical protein [Telluribacter humicola]
MLAIIESGFYDESQEVVIRADVADGTLTLLYDDITKAELGQQPILSGKAIISLSTPLEEGQRLIAYLGDYGEKTYGAVNVVASHAQRTGWKVPDMVDGVPYADYLSDGGAPIASTYEPDACYNRAQAYESDIEAALHQECLSFVVEIQNTVIATVPTAIVVVKEVQHAPGGALYSFDGATAGNTNSKSYTANGTFKVLVMDAEDSENAKEVEFEIALLSAPAPVNSSIKLLWFDPQPTAPDGPVVVLSTYATQEVEFSVDGVSQFSNIPVGEHNGSWVTGHQYKTNFWARILLLPSTGDFTARVRIKSNTADQKAFDIKL